MVLPGVRCFARVLQRDDTASAPCDSRQMQRMVPKPSVLSHAAGMQGLRGCSPLPAQQGGLTWSLSEHSLQEERWDLWGDVSQHLLENMMLEEISALTPQTHSKAYIKGYLDNLNTSSNMTLRTTWRERNLQAISAAGHKCCPQSNMLYSSP